MNATKTDGPVCEILADGLLTINGRPYEYERIPTPQSDCVALVRLSYGVEALTSYDCTLLASGHHDCSCGAFIFRYPTTGELCKHLKALIAVGLLPAATADVPENDPEPVDKEPDGGDYDPEPVDPEEADYEPLGYDETDCWYREDLDTLIVGPIPMDQFPF